MEIEKDKITEYFDELSRKLGVEALKLDEFGEANLAFDEVIVSIKNQEENLLLISKITDAPTENEELIYDFLLKINHLGKLNAYIGLQEENKVLTCVTKEESYALDAEKIYATLENHVNNVIALRKLIVDLQNMQNSKTNSFATHNMLRA